MQPTLYRLAIIVACLASCLACSNELPDISVEGFTETELPFDAIVLSGVAHAYPIPTVEKGNIETIEFIEGDFIFPINKDTLYVEQNDGVATRMARITLRMSGGYEQQLTLSQPPASRATSVDKHHSFYRHHGIGYSYDALGGDYCDLASVRCQVLNRAVIDYINEMEVEPFIRVDYQNQMHATSNVYTSVVDYIQHSNFYASGKAKILMYSGEASATCSAFEDGQIDTYILHEERLFQRAMYQVEVSNIADYVAQYPNLLTSSFRTALAKLAATDANDWKAVDDFIATYGTHVVHATELGARINVDVQVETHKFNQIVNEEVLSKQAIATLFKEKNSSESQETNYQILSNRRCRVDVLGGDLSTINVVVGMSMFSNENITSSMLDKWMESIYFDDDDLEHSNVEMINMEVIPIWELIPDPVVADRVEARIQDDAAELQRLLGNRNFLNASFPYPVKKVTCRIGNKKQTFSNPAVTDIIVSGRHVATVCHEYVPEITTKEKVYVAYPIYEGRVKLTDGYCIYQNKAYSVDWRHNKYTVTALGDVKSDGNLYLNCGMLSATAYDNLIYQKGYPILGCERPGGIAIDGTLAGEMVKVEKHFGHFYLQDNTKKYTNLPGWDYCTTDPAETKNYSDYFKKGYRNRMVRRDDYTYIYNTTEIGHE